MAEIGKVVAIQLEEEMQHSYIDYAMSVIVGRALPDVRDGLKPVHRRILYAMYEAGMTPDKPHKKSARVVGDVLARYHPHGDTAVYDAMVRLAQPFSTRYPLVDGHGNFGSVDGDSPAAMRYTEARLSRIAMEMLADIDKDTVDFIPNYDESGKEPTVLPSRFPNLLVNGSAGIAVGMATNIPPHNLGEVIDALVLLIDKPETGIKELMLLVKGPDFPTSGLIVGRQGIKEAYQNGRGSIKMRARAQIESMQSGREQIVVTELPYQVNKAKLVERIAELVREKKVEGVSDLRDESDRTGMRVVVELKRDANAQIILNQLYKHTQMQETFGVIMLALVDGKPQVLNLKSLLTHYLEHQKVVVTRRTSYELQRARERAHILEGLRIALANLDAVIKTIRQSGTVDEARRNLMERFGLSEKQAQAILDMRLQRLTGMEREKLEQEYKELLARIEQLSAILADEGLLWKGIKEELLDVKKRFADKRRTQITGEEEKLEIEDLIAEEDVAITVTHRGYVKRLPADTYRSQKRGGKGITALTTRAEDFVEHLFVATTHHYLLFFTSSGKVFRLKAYEIPEGGRQAKGTPLANLVNISSEDKVTAVIPVKEFLEEQFLFMATAQGIVKKTSLKDYNKSRRDGLIALRLGEGDELIGVELTGGQAELLLATRKGLSLRFPETEVRGMGREARGVKGISLTRGDRVVGMVRLEERVSLLAITERGFGKRTAQEDYRVQSRGGKGILTLKNTPRIGNLVGMLAVREEEEVMLITHEGIIIRMAVSGIPLMGRSTQGVTLMRLGEEGRVVAVAKVQSKEDETVQE